jgi:hypothetical protein
VPIREVGVPDGHPPVQGSWPAAAVAGIGPTVSLFIASLAFPTMALDDQARVGILAGSPLAATVGLVLLRGALSITDGPPAGQAEHESTREAE